MKLVTTMGDFYGQFNSDKQIIKELKKAGFKHVDMDFFNGFNESSVYLKDGYLKEVLDLKEQAKKLNVDFLQAHLPCINYLKNAVSYDFSVNAVVRCMEICDILEIENAVLHFIVKEGFTKEQTFIENKKYVNDILDRTKNKNVNILMENFTLKGAEGIYLPCSASDLLEGIKYINSDRVHACWDTGHCNCENLDQYEEIVKLGKELYGIHYNDNHGEKDEHIMPFLGTLNHDSVLTALKDIGYNGEFTLECPATLRTFNCWTGARKPFDKDDRLKEPPLLIRREMEKVLYKTARYLLEKYGEFED